MSLGMTRVHSWKHTARMDTVKMLLRAYMAGFAL
jgi:hypothetical protein